LQPLNAHEGDTKPGLRLFRGTGQICLAVQGREGPESGSFRYLLGHGPPKGHQCTGHGDDDLMDMFAFGHKRARPCAEPDLRLPADGLHRWGELCQAQWQVTTDFGTFATAHVDDHPGTINIGDWHMLDIFEVEEILAEFFRRETVGGEECVPCWRARQERQRSSSVIWARDLGAWSASGRRLRPGVIQTCGRLSVCIL
jgi:hypothetical protein